MPQSALRLVLTPEERETLTAWSRSSSGEHRLVERSNIILLLAAEGLWRAEIARRLKHASGARASKWRQRFSRHRLAGLEDAQRSGKPELTKIAEKQSLHYWIQIHRIATASGTVVCWRQHWVTSATIRSGEFSQAQGLQLQRRRSSSSRPASRSSDRRRPMLWDCI